MLHQLDIHFVSQIKYFKYFHKQSVAFGTPFHLSHIKGVRLPSLKWPTGIGERQQNRRRQQEELDSQSMLFPYKICVGLL